MWKRLCCVMACLWLLTPMILAEDAPTLVIYSRTGGFRHASIPVGVRAISRVAEEAGFRVVATEDQDELVSSLDEASTKVVLFLSTTGNVLDDQQQAAFEAWYRKGNGFVGIHAAADTEYDWAWYGGLVGAYFKNHPEIQEAEIRVIDRKHPSTKMLPERWVRTDEWYNYRANPRENVHVLCALNVKSYRGSDMGYDHPITWCQEYDGGRSWYTGLGHTAESYDEPLFLEHVLGGIRWAAGVGAGNDADAGVTDWSRYRKVVLDEHVTDPMELDVAPDGRVFFIERHGHLKIWKPDAGRTVVAGWVPVFQKIEDGMLGLALDPDFAITQWIYLYYSPPGDEPKQRLSRFTMRGDVLDAPSELVMLEVPTQRDECCHSGGSLQFGPDGCLYLSTGDNTNPFASDGYAPIDEREGRSAWDAQKSSANTNDLRGKILRIRPLTDGSYAIPEGNLFPPDGSMGRPEIYVMGCRNPFRISIDAQSGWLYWGDVGPDAGAPTEGRGPAGHDEINQARGPGFFGWPYFVGRNLAYHDYDFETKVSGPAFDPERPINDSPNNTGAHALPSAQPAWIAYPYGASEDVPEFGDGGRCAMAGPVYHADLHERHPNALPEFFDGSIFIYEWTRNWIKEVRLDDEGHVLAIQPFMAGTEFIRPMDLEVGPDGRLYVIEWGTEFGGGSDDAKVCRIDYYPPGMPIPEESAASASTNASAQPTLRFVWPPEGGVVGFGEHVRYEIVAADPASSFEDQYVTVHARMGHDTHFHDGESAVGLHGELPIIFTPHHDETMNCFPLLAARLVSTPDAPESVLRLQPRRKQAEHFSSNRGVILEATQDEGGGTALAYIENGDHVSYRPVNLTGVEAIRFRVASNAEGGIIEVRADNPEGPLVATASVPGTGGWQKWTDAESPVTDPGGTRELFLVFKGGKGSLFNVNWFEFVGPGVSAND